MLTNELINSNLGLNLNYWQGVHKPERVFLAKQIMKQLGYKGGNKTLFNYELIEGIDKVTLTKKQFPDFFKQLGNLELLGLRSGSVIMLYESGVWKLIMQSRKKVGIQTRNWLAREVLPSIATKGNYDIVESQFNPLSYLNEFTEEKKQLQNSKDVNAKIFGTTKDFRAYHNKVHKLVNNMTAKEIQKMFNSKQSARAIIREHIPENAATIAIIDEIFKTYNKSLSEIEQTDIQNSAKQTFKALFELGVKPLM